jgi:transcription elongation factor Elf1
MIRAICCTYLNLILSSYQIQQAVELVPKMAPKEKLRAVQFWNQISEHLQVIVNNSASEINALASYMQEQEAPNNCATASSAVNSSGSVSTSTNNAQLDLNGQVPILGDKSNIDFEELAKQMESDEPSTSGTVNSSTNQLDNASGLTAFDLSAQSAISIDNFIPDESCLDEMQLIASPILTESETQRDSHLSMFTYEQPPMTSSTNETHLMEAPAQHLQLTANLQHTPPPIPIENSSKEVPTPSTASGTRTGSRSTGAERRFECELCGARFTAKHSLLVHVRRHTGERPFACEHCGRTFAQSSVFKAHLDTHLNDRKYTCEVCNKKFSQRPQLRLHLQRHKGERRWACSSCDARFVTRADLTRHALAHSGTKRFSCALCEKRFTRRQTLEEHSNRHFGIRPYSCGQCDKQFVEQSAYNKVCDHLNRL